MIDAIVTIQTVAAWEILQKQTVLRNERRFLGQSDPDAQVLRAYDWLCGQMEHRIAPCPVFGMYPLWAWAQWDGVRRSRPDLRSGGHLPGGTEGVRLEVEIPEERVLLSDFDLWHYALNYWYLPSGEQDDRWFEQCCVEKGIDFYQMKPLPDRALHERLMKSWEKIFDLEWIYEPVTRKRKRDKRIQATFWTLRVAEVQSVRSFRAR